MSDLDKTKRMTLQEMLMSRRTVLRGAIGLSMAAFIAACGGGGDDDENGDDPTATTNNGADGNSTATEMEDRQEPGTHTVEHAMGVTEIAAEPQRVVVLDQGEMDMALALGVHPVGAALYTADQEFASYIQDELGEYTRVGTVGEPDLEAVAALDPDLIITNMTRHEAIYETLSEIAPTVMAASLGADWKESFELVARALGRSDRHQEIMSDYTNRIAAFQEAMGDRLGQTHVTVVRSMPDQIRLYMKDSFIGRVIEDSGLPRPPVQDQEIFMEEISAERIRDLEADVIFTLYWNPEQGEQLSTLIENPLWDQLTAVQAGQVYEMDDEVWGTGLGPLAAMEVIDDLTEVLVDGEIDASVWSPDKGGGEDSFPVTLDHKFGSTTIESAPERVVIVGLIEQDAFLALGTVPIATREWYGERPGAIFEWAEEYLGDADVPERMAYELDFELIASLEPDVIVGLYSGTTQEEYDILSEIAPTVAQPEEFVDWGIPWQELTVRAGVILGKEDEAVQMVGELEGMFGTVQQENPDFVGASAVIASPFGLPENYYVYSSQDGRGRLIERLGFVMPEIIDEMAGEEYGATISIEQLDIVADLDALIWVANEDALADVQLYQTLPIVQEGRVLYYGEDSSVYDAMNFSTILSLPFAIEQLVPALVAAIDGDPNTEPPSE